MVFCFSGTGNSLFAAKIIAQKLEDELVSINEIMRQRSLDPYVARYAFSSERPLVFVSPTYCWRLPKFVEQFISESRFEGNRKAYFFLTCGDGTGAAAYYAEDFCRRAELEFMGLGSVKMPENYITMFNAPSYDDARAIIRAAVPSIEYAAGQISLEKHMKDINGRPGDKNVNKIINPAFYRLFINDKKFYVTNACVGCGLCEKLCPTANISLVDGKPQWHGSCIQCQSCIGVCPKNAIEFGRRAKGKRRYYLLPNGEQKK